MKIGYRGDSDGFTLEALDCMLDHLGISDADTVPMRDCDKIVSSLKNEGIRYGVMEIVDTAGGRDASAINALKHQHLRLVDTCVMQLRYFLFAAKGVRPEDVDTLIVGDRSYARCREYIESRFPDAKIVRTKDMIPYLSIDTGTTAFVTSEGWGNGQGLEILESDVEGGECSAEFRLYAVGDYDIDNDTLAPFSERLAIQVTSEKGLGFLVKGLVVLAIYAVVFTMEYFEIGIDNYAAVLGTSVSVIFLLLTSVNVKQKLRYKTIEGYWKYTSWAEGEEDMDQKHQVPRVVEIKNLDGKLCLRGWMCDKETVQLFESTDSMVSPAGVTRGSLIYWYASPQDINRKFNLNGIVILKWTTNNPANKINMMSGWYLGNGSKEFGNIQYIRISKEEFDTMKKCEYL